MEELTMYDSYRPTNLERLNQALLIISIETDIIKFAGGMPQPVSPLEVAYYSLAIPLLTYRKFRRDMHNKRGLYRIVEKLRD
jgi:hypothetical protein